MDRENTFVPNDQVPSAYLNSQQDKMPGVRPLDAELQTLWKSRAVQGLIAQFAATLVPANSSVGIDQEATPAMDWRKHIVSGLFVPMAVAGGDEYLGGADEPSFNVEVKNNALPFICYLGTGDNGSFLSTGYFQRLNPAEDWYLYCDDTDGRLMLYNADAVDRAAFIIVQSLGELA